MTTLATLRQRLTVLKNDLDEIIADGYGVLPEMIADTLARFEGYVESAIEEMAGDVTEGDA